MRAPSAAAHETRSRSSPALRVQHYDAGVGVLAENLDPFSTVLRLMRCITAQAKKLCEAVSSRVYAIDHEHGMVPGGEHLRRWSSCDRHSALLNPNGISHP
jgi:hypothetical protein